jgi:hypothetical protein
MSDGNAKLENVPLLIRLRIKVFRRITPSTKRKIKKTVNLLPSRSSKSYKTNHTNLENPILDNSVLKPGDTVRIRTMEEIKTTLDRWGALKGCTFISAMEEYCGSTQKILKPVTRFLDERDYQVKKSDGIVLLEGLICEGIPTFGQCDRSCFYFWRVEWLELVTE